MLNLETPLLISDIDVHPPLAHPCGPSTLAASILAGSPTQLEPLTFQTSRFARNLENRGIVFPLSPRRTTRSRFAQKSKQDTRLRTQGRSRRGCCAEFDAVTDGRRFATRLTTIWFTP